MTFGEKVKALREEKGMSQDALAKEIGVTARSVRNWELKNLVPRNGVVYEKLAKSLGCETAYLVSSEDAFVTEASEKYGFFRFFARTSIKVLLFHISQLLTLVMYTI